MLAGTGSDVGKSLIATGLCRIFRQDGFNPAPFKAQNMALNSYATPDGFEIGRAQAVQAEAAGIDCSTDMNPILLKPSGQHTSQVVINGKPSGNADAYQYFRKEGKEELRRIAHEAFDRLNALYNPIVLEGAGSISELNLRDGDIVNMSMAEYAVCKMGLADTGRSEKHEDSNRLLRILQTYTVALNRLHYFLDSIILTDDRSFQAASHLEKA